MPDLDRWSRLLSAAAAEGQTQPERICQMCVQMLGVTGAGISMVTRTGNRGVVCATDDRASRIEDIQLTAGVGPCIDAVHSGSPILVSDLDDTGDIDITRWSSFGETVRDAGVRAVFAFPLRIGAITVGAMDLYRDTVGDLSPGEMSAALLAADAAAIALLHLNIDGDEAFEPSAVSRADYRLHVHQATGMVSVQLKVSVEEALLRLRARAFATGRSVSDVAADVVARRLRFDEEDS